MTPDNTLSPGGLIAGQSRKIPVLERSGGAAHALPDQQTTPGVAHEQVYEVPMPIRARRSGDVPVTDARYPERWLSDQRVYRLSGNAHKLFTTALAWSVANRTDGIVEDGDLQDLRYVDPSLAQQLADVGLWRRVDGRWLITVFADTQTTRTQLETLEATRRAEREKKARQRSRATTSPSPAVPGDSASQVSPGTPLGQERLETGQERKDLPPTRTENSAVDPDPRLWESPLDEPDPPKPVVGRSPTWTTDLDPYAKDRWEQVARGYDH